MKRLQWFLAALIAAALVVLAAPAHLARADAGSWEGFGYGEKYACQVCTAQQMADHNQLALKGA